MNSVRSEKKTRNKIQLGAVLAIFSLALLFRASLGIWGGRLKHQLNIKESDLSYRSVDLAPEKHLPK